MRRSVKTGIIAGIDDGQARLGDGLTLHEVRAPGSDSAATRRPAATHHRAIRARRHAPRFRLRQAVWPATPRCADRRVLLRPRSGRIDRSFIDGDNYGEWLDPSQRPSLFRIAATWPGMVTIAMWPESSVATSAAVRAVDLACKSGG